MFLEEEGPVRARSRCPSDPTTVPCSCSDVLPTAWQSEPQIAVDVARMTDHSFGVLDQGHPGAHPWRRAIPSRSGPRSTPEGRVGGGLRPGPMGRTAPVGCWMVAVGDGVDPDDAVPGQCSHEAVRWSAGTSRSPRPVATDTG